MNIKLFFALVVLSLSMAKTGFGQLTIEGPTCVTANTVYQYSIRGNIKVNSKLQLCVKGGSILDMPGYCIRDSAFSYIRVTWDERVTSGSIQLNSSESSSIKEVSLALPLSPGSISSDLKKQDIEYNVLPTKITCSTPSGGSCSPSYSFQWQKSLDGNSWVDIVGQSNQDLSFPSVLTETAYFRRKVKEKASNSEAYSNVVVVYVGINKKSR